MVSVSKIQQLDQRAEHSRRLPIRFTLLVYWCIVGFRDSNIVNSNSDIPLPTNQFFHMTIIFHFKYVNLRSIEL